MKFGLGLGLRLMRLRVEEHCRGTRGRGLGLGFPGMSRSWILRVILSSSFKIMRIRIGGCGRLGRCRETSLRLLLMIYPRLIFGVGLKLV